MGFYYDTPCHSTAFRTKPVFIIGSNRTALLHSTGSFIIWLRNILCCPKTKITQRLPSELESETHSHSQTKDKYCLLLMDLGLLFLSISSFYSFFSYFRHPGLSSLTCSLSLSSKKPPFSGKRFVSINYTSL